MTTTPTASLESYQVGPEGGLAEPHRTSLSNGLRVLVLETPHISSASVGLYIRVGSRFEGEGEHGLSHLVEHLLFRGCGDLPDADALNVAIETLCPFLDASTGREFTALEASCEPGALPALLELIASMVRDCLLQSLDKEREIILHEIADEVDGDGRDLDVDNVAKAALFPGAGLGRKIGGSPRSLKRLDRADCQRWLDRHFVANNMVLSIAVPRDVEHVLTCAEAAFAGLKTGELVHPAAAACREDLPALETVQDPSSTRASVQAAWLLPAESHPDWAALRMVHRLLDDGSCARLRRRIIDELALAYHVSADLAVYDGLTLLTVDVEAAHHQVSRVVDIIDEVLAALVQQPISSGEWDRIRRRYLFEIQSLRDAPSAHCAWLGVQELFPPCTSLQDRLNEVLSVLPEDVARVTETYLGPSGRQLTVVGNLPPMERAGLRRRIHQARAFASG